MIAKTYSFECIELYVALLDSFGSKNSFELSIENKVSQACFRNFTVDSFVN